MLKDELRKCRDRLAAAGLEAPDFEAQCLVEHVTGYSRTAQIIRGGEALSSAQTKRLDELTEKRLTHYPLQYLLGSWSFMGFELEVGQGVLIPRDDTEVAVGLCLDFLKTRPQSRVIDLCSGSGAIAIALACLSGAEVTAVELSDKAFYFLEKNINSNKAAVKAAKGDVLSCHADYEDGSYDLIVSNPPYIRTDELPTLQPEVRFEPKLALDGGESGYDFYEAIVKNWSRKLKPNGALVFELGEGQAAYVSELMRAQGFADIRTALDLGGEQRAIIGTMLDK